jgi:phosphoglycolate phosphatase
VRQAVGTLRERGYVCAICTNKPERMAEKLMTRLGFRDDFAALIGADTLAVRKPDPEPLRQSVLRAGGDPSLSLIVGDTVTDRDTGRAAGVPVILVGFGPEGRAVEALGPDHIIDHYDELPDLVGRLLPRQNVRTP